MTEFNYKYEGLKDRQKQITLAEGLGRVMLQDNFDNPDWKHGDPLIGTMIFTDEPGLSTPPARGIAAEIDELKTRLEALGG